MVDDGAAHCPACGHTLGAATSEPHPAGDGRSEITPEEREFEAKLYRFPVVTAAFLAVCVLLWGWMEIVGSSEDASLLLIFGAKETGLIKAGEWWRLVSASFLHIGWKHLIFNGIALAQLGLFCENIFGRGRFIALYIACGAGGFALATAFSTTISAGASASLFGLMGAMLVFGWRHRAEIPPFFQRLFTWMLLPWVLLNLGIGGIIANVDNLAHIGGLIAGVLLAAVLNNHIVGDGSDADRSAGLPIGLASLGLLAVVIGLVAADGKVMWPVLTGIDEAAEAGDIPQMEKGWGDMIAQKPVVGLFYANRAETRILIGELEGAEADFKRAIALGHSPTSIRNQLAWMLLTRKEPSKAEINAALRLAKKSVAQRRGAGNLNTLGWAHYLKGEYAASRTYLEAALELAQKKSWWEIAIAPIERLWGDEPKEAAAFDLYMLAMVHHQLGNEAQAKAFLFRGDAASEVFRSNLAGEGSATVQLSTEDELATLDAIAARAHALLQPPDVETFKLPENQADPQ